MAKYEVHFIVRVEAPHTLEAEIKAGELLRADGPDFVQVEELEETHG